MAQAGMARRVGRRRMPPTTRTGATSLSPTARLSLTGEMAGPADLIGTLRRTARRPRSGTTGAAIRIRMATARLVDAVRAVTPHSTPIPVMPLIRPDRTAPTPTAPRARLVPRACPARQGRLIRQPATDRLTPTSRLTPTGGLTPTAPTRTGGLTPTLRRRTHMAR